MERFEAVEPRGVVTGLLAGIAFVLTAVLANAPTLAQETKPTRPPKPAILSKTSIL